MLLLGLLLLAATGAFTGLLISENFSGGPNYAVGMFDNNLGTLNTLGAFLAGIGLALVFCIGLAMLMGGGARQRHKAAELREARRDAASNAAERDALAARVGEGPMTAQSTGREPGYARSGGARSAPEVRAPSTRRHRRHGMHLFGH